MLIAHPRQGRPGTPWYDYRITGEAPSVTVEHRGPDGKWGRWKRPYRTLGAAIRATRGHAAFRPW